MPLARSENGTSKPIQTFDREEVSNLIVLEVQVEPEPEAVERARGKVAIKIGRFR
jgi:hypothetical protein